MNKSLNLECKYCKKILNNYLSLGGHQTNCLLNPNKNERLEKISNSGKNRILSQETKDKISKSIKNYLDENPGKIPYLLNHSSKESYPEKIFREALEIRNINGWIYNLPIKRFSLDFAFINNKIDVEIDGNTHNLESVIKKDLNINEILLSLGWKTIRFTAKEIKNDVNSCIDRLLLEF